MTKLYSIMTAALAFSALSFSTFASSAEAATTLYDTKAAWEAAAGPTTVIDLSLDPDGNALDPDVNTAIVPVWSLQGVTFYSVGTLRARELYDFGVASAPIRFDLPAGTTSIGLGFRTLNIFFATTATLRLSNGEVFSLNAPMLTSSLVHHFVGAISTTPIEWAEISLQNAYPVVSSLSIASSSVKEVGISVRPKIAPEISGMVSVGILAGEDFDAANVDVSTVRFGATGTEAIAERSALGDVNSNGKQDMILHFRVDQTGVLCGMTEVKLSGKTNDGQSFKGSAPITTTGCK